MQIAANQALANSKHVSNLPVSRDVSDMDMVRIYSVENSTPARGYFFRPGLRLARVATSHCLASDLLE
jgi:hypothetical protein